MIVDEGWEELLAWYWTGASRPTTFKAGPLQLLAGGFDRGDTLSSHSGWTDRESDFGGRQTLTFLEPVAFTSQAFQATTHPVRTATVRFTNDSGSNKTLHGAYVTDETTLHVLCAFSGVTVADGESIDIEIRVGPSRGVGAHVSGKFEFESATIDICGSGNTLRDDTTTSVSITSGGQFGTGAETQDNFMPDELIDADGSGDTLDLSAAAFNSYQTCWTDVHPTISWPTDGAIAVRIIDANSISVYFAGAEVDGEYDVDAKVWAVPDPSTIEFEHVTREGWIDMVDGFFRTGTRPSTFYVGGIEDDSIGLQAHDLDTLDSTQWGEETVEPRGEITFAVDSGKVVAQDGVAGTPGELVNDTASTIHSYDGYFITDVASGTSGKLIAVHLRGGFGAVTETIAHQPAENPDHALRCEAELDHPA